jgi:simple sugar transport system permease protein
VSNSVSNQAIPAPRALVPQQERELTPAERSRSRTYRLQQSAIDVLVLFLILQIGSIVYAEIDPDAFPYTSSANISIALQVIPLVGIPALGVGVLMIAGEFDLSVGANYVFSGMVMAKLAAEGLDPFVAALACLAVGAGIGFLNGAITLAFRVPSFITTLGTTGIWASAALLINSSSIPFTPDSSLFGRITSGDIDVVPAEVLWFLGAAVIVYVFLQRSSVGSHVFAVGGNRTAAVANGIRVSRVKLLAFMISGLCASLAAVLAASRTGVVSPDGGLTLPLQAIAACVVGGLMLTGGRGTVLGIVLGAALIYWIQDVLLLTGAPGYYLDAFVGALVIAAAAAYSVMRTRRG